jgi:hypothetical protein
MKKLILSMAAGIVLCTAGFTGYKIYDNRTMSPQDILMAKNIQALTQGEDSEEYEHYFNVGHYRVVRSGDGGGEIEIIQEPEGTNPRGGMKIQITSDVVLVTYINDCQWYRNRVCYENIRQTTTLYSRN